MDQWWNEFEDIDYSGGEPVFIENDGEDMIHIAYRDGMVIDAGMDKDNVYVITVAASDDKEGWDSPLCVLSFADRDMLHDKLQEIIDRFREDAPENDENERRIAEVLDKYSKDFLNTPKEEIRALITGELAAPVKDNTEYLRLLCAILFCVGDKEDAQLIKKVKYSGSMDILDAIDKDWISCLENDGENAEDMRSRDEIISDIMLSYFDYED